MDKNETQFIESIWCKEGKYDFIAASLNIDAKGLVEFFKKNAEHIKANNGYITIEVLRARSDRSKLYAKFTPFTPKPKVEAEEHLPDRNKEMADKEPVVEETEDDLPF